MREESASRAGAANPARELTRAIQQYEDVLPLLADVNVLGDPKMRALDSALDRWMPGLSDQPGYPSLRGQIALRWVGNEPPNEVSGRLRAGRTRPSCCAPEDSAADLARSVSESGPPPVPIGPLTWLSAAPDSLRNDPEAGPYLYRIARAISELLVATNRRTESRAAESRLSAAQHQQNLRLPPPQVARGRASGLVR